MVDWLSCHVCGHVGTCEAASAAVAAAAIERSIFSRAIKKNGRLNATSHTALSYHEPQQPPSAQDKAAAVVVAAAAGDPAGPRAVIEEEGAGH